MGELQLNEKLGSSNMKNQGVHILFEEQARLNPSKVAIVNDGKSITYDALNNCANHLASRLIEMGHNENDIVGIWAERNIGSIVGMIAVLKAGGIYVPLDPEYPENRLKFMINECNAKMIIIPNEGKLPYDFDVCTLNFDMQNIPDKKSGYISNFHCTLASVLFTSGSTGEPKGVLVKHQGIVRTVKDIEYINLSSNDRMLQLNSQGFDVSFFEIWGALTNGLTLYIINREDSLDASKFEEFINSNGITTIVISSPFFNKLVNIKSSIFEGVKNLLVGGDVLSPKHINSVREHCKDINIVNAYGPTENTIFSTTYKITDTHYERIPIGRPIKGSSAYILSSDEKLVPVGIQGELYLGGLGVTGGYINRQDLSEERFRDDPFMPGHKMYKTGDLAKWLPDGNIDFLGRNDSQVKIRGYRIELDEIKNKLSQMEEIKESHIEVCSSHSNEKELIVYYSSDMTLKQQDIIQHLKCDLPDYMVPNKYYWVQEFPLTQNGKIDHDALLNYFPYEEEGDSTDINLTIRQKKIRDIWCKILGTDRPIGMEEDFFKIGGHSLKAMVLQNEINREFSSSIPLKEIMDNRTIYEQDALLESAIDPMDSEQLDEGIVLLKKVAGDKNVFFIHSGNGDIIEYLDLCSTLDDSINCIGIKYFDNDIAPKNQPLEALAKKYAQKIKSYQNKGPYSIVGWSTGGVIGVEISRALLNSGDEIEQLLIIDSPTPSVDDEIEYFTLKSEVEFVSKYVHPNNDFGKCSAPKSIDEIWEFDYEIVNIDEVLLRLPKYISVQMKNKSEISNYEFLQSLNTIRTLRLALINYQPKTIDCPIHLVKASESDHVDYSTWEELSNGQLIISEIAGDHLSVLKKDYSGLIC